MPVRIGIICKSDVKSVFHLNQSGHGVGRGAVHSNFPILVDRHERKSRVNGAIDHLDGKFVAIGNRVPVMDGGTAQRVYTDFQTGL